MDKFDIPRYHQACARMIKKRQDKELQQQLRYKESEDFFIAQGIEFDRKRGVTWLVTIDSEKFLYNAKTGNWKPIGSNKWYRSSSVKAFLGSVHRNALTMEGGKE